MRHVNPFEPFVAPRAARPDGEQWLDGHPVAADGRPVQTRRVLQPRWLALAAAVVSLLVGVGVS